jgi:hypothetical protein
VDLVDQTEPTLFVQPPKMSAESQSKVALILGSPGTKVKVAGRSVTRHGRGWSQAVRVCTHASG